jgi:DNA-binding LytR/AlgR family response regulator
MNVVIIEDESLSALRLEKIIREIDPAIEVLAKLESVEESVAWFKAHPGPDLIFLDIHLEDGLGFSIFEQVKIKSPIIFTTAFDEYAIKAFKLRSIDYLLKPITADDLEAALRKYRDWSLPERNVIDVQELFDLIGSRKNYKERFSITVGQRIRSIAVDDIAYFYSESGITFLVCKEKIEYPVDFSLDTLETELDPRLFFRVNRQFLVKLPAIANVHIYPKSRLKLDLNPPPRQEVFVSVDRVAGFRRWFDR